MQKKQATFLKPTYFQDSLAFTHPGAYQHKSNVFPIFMPFAGCQVRCIFCAQTAQTGREEEDIYLILEELEDYFKGLFVKKREGLDLAFFGGTFTALPLNEQFACLDFAKRWRDKGRIQKIRCSTRPDFLSLDLLNNLKDRGLDMVELGIQSFDDSVLRKSSRGYTGSKAMEACEIVKKSGLKLGIQLMQGLPGHTLEQAKKDVELSISFMPDSVRLYPCLVFKGTALAGLWQDGEYRPWELEKTLNFLEWALLKFWEKEIPIIRMGVAQEESAKESFLAGPYHPSLGNIARSRALFSYIEVIMNRFLGESQKVKELKVPEKYQGEIWGFKAELKPWYERMGIKDLSFWNKSEFKLFLS